MKVLENGNIRIEAGDPYISDDELYDDGMHSMNDEEWKAYSKQLDESQGFDVGEFPNVFHYGLIQPMSFEGDDEDLIYFTNLGIAHYNEKEVASLKLVEILKVNAQACSPFNFYITFEAKDASTGERGTYQTKVYGRCPIKSSYVDFTRVKPETKPEVGPSDIKARERDEEEEQKEGKRLKI
ncbi:uncharacterized protein LOC116215074 isoform X1 [Punica granatum]|uniref:Uncharacterized protein LOC116215074 isoform X1 n=1 Tax=Punica granatum TaxID=22663 RepID=A0A6P8EL36_PUNGR|nr:uncharacterized protein LOC116215074 isoform X1 [Punica granatum]XP_031406504.1 uncharacterized protein LOC116215074 isoform X1 [Punica granatum]